ncbi:cold shock domain-containing protein (plasmid) [Rhodococcus sp. JS3073]|nr:cold shock domain-containing protein [Rhodococcus sp. JS3073]
MKVQRREGLRFIAPDDGTPDAFVHYSEISGSGTCARLHDRDRPAPETAPRPTAANTPVTPAAANIPADPVANRLTIDSKSADRGEARHQPAVRPFPIVLG